MRGIILAGGNGSRLHPITWATSKQLMPVYDKPMIYYPLTTLITAGIRDILVIVSPQHRQSFERVLGTGRHLGIRIQYAIQPEPRGIADALRIYGDHVNAPDEDITLVLGDNIFHGVDIRAHIELHRVQGGARIFAYQVSNPQDYGVVELDGGDTVLSIVEKPTHPTSVYAVPGLYTYDSSAVEIARSLRPSARNELEITDVNAEYLHRGELHATLIERGAAWLDTGTFTSLMHAAEFVRVVEERQGVKIGCVEEAAWRAGFITDGQLAALGHQLRASGYGDYLLNLLTDRR